MTGEGQADRHTGSQSVDRALTILALFDDHTTKVTLAEVADRLGVHRSTASRLLAALARRGFVEQDSSTGCFRPGLGLISLAGLALRRFPCRMLARRVVFDLRDATGETTQLGVLDGADVLYIEEASSPHVSVNVDWLGKRQLASESVSGRLLLALHAEGTGPSDSEAAAIRERGWLVGSADDDALGEPMAGVAVPIRNQAGQVVYALAIGGPAHRVTQWRLETELIALALRGASRVSEMLGYRQW